MKTLEKVPIRVEFVDEVPFENFERGVLYVSKKQMSLSHCCLCDCQRFVRLPLDRINDNGDVLTKNNNGWSLTIKDSKATVTPSILNHPCECHYIITNGIANIV
jgi:hypothetical protein